MQPEPRAGRMKSPAQSDLGSGVLLLTAAKVTSRVSAHPSLRHSCMLASDRGLHPWGPDAFAGPHERYEPRSMALDIRIWRLSRPHDSHG
jgi:hypothetical protein